MNDMRVFGESARELFEVFRGVQRLEDKDGLAQLKIEIPRGSESLVERALKQAEAELLVCDADGSKVDPESRTPGQRRYDAFMLLITETCSALEVA